MTEAEWLARTDPQSMLEILRDKASDRKLRLFACACCRELWMDIRNERCRRAVEVAEQFADGNSCKDQLRAAYETAREALDELVTEIGPPAEDAAGWVASESATSAAENVLRCCSQAGGSIAAQYILWWRQKRRMRTFQVRAFRDIFGNPFHLIKFNLAWCTSTTVAISAQMYDSRDFSAMPILADALQDAGCDSDDILSHCRDATATHVRGCWVVDLVLGKS